MRCYNLRESCDFVLRSATVTYNHSLSIKNMYLWNLCFLYCILQIEMSHRFSVMAHRNWKCPIDFDKQGANGPYLRLSFPTTREKSKWSKGCVQSKPSQCIMYEGKYKYIFDTRQLWCVLIDTLYQLWCAIIDTLYQLWCTLIDTLYQMVRQKV